MGIDRLEDRKYIGIPLLVGHVDITARLCGMTRTKKPRQVAGLSDHEGVAGNARKGNPLRINGAW